jgi:hypothetical protein
VWTSPRLIISIASPMACPPLAQADTTVWFGPRIPVLIAIWPEAQSGTRYWMKLGDARDGPRSSSSLLWSSRILQPPMAVPTMMPISSRLLWSTVIPESSIASLAAATAKRELRSSRRASFGSTYRDASKPLTSPKMRTANGAGSKRVVVLTPDLPAMRADQVVSRSLPSGVTAPMPVTTTRFGKESLLCRAGIVATVIRGAVLSGNTRTMAAIRGFYRGRARRMPSSHGIIADSDGVALTDGR